MGKNNHWLALLGTLAATAMAVSIAGADHGTPGGSGGVYVPPAPEPVPPRHGKYWKVAQAFAHEVWLVDQSDSPGTSFGGRIFIYDDEQVRRDAATAVPEVIDLAGATASLCMAQTGANPVRPHMLAFNNEDSHAVLSFVASGHVVFFDAATRAPLACFRTEVGAGGARQAHAVWPAPDDSYVLVANQNGKKFERINTDFATETFTQDPAATLNLATCTTPNGLPCQDALLRPDNAPICPFVPQSGYPAYVSLRGGGMFAIDPFTTPMSIVAEYDAEHIPRDGCGFIEAKGFVFGNGGGGNPANPDGWLLWRLPEAGPDVYDPLNPVNTPEPLILSHDTSGPRDAHGVAHSRQEKYVYFFDRAANVVEIYRAATGAYVKTESLVSPFSSDPTPDLAGEAPDGKYVYLSLRGPNPLSGDPHASTGSTPGLLVIELLHHGQDMAVRGLAPISNIDAGGVQRADGHGIRVRRVN
ncbi:hypothetical protein [Sorangium sp. So ce233]|uniref:hypothetical protein n=1 Tax=Sorangium sp. So ce233 TaxID=3133290 RepID=UPI003F61DA63